MVRTPFAILRKLLTSAVFLGAGMQEERGWLFLLLECFIIAKAAGPYSVSGCTVDFTSVKY
jgi:hypothetical protein